MTDITVIINFHREGALAIPALASMMDLVSAARADGLTVEASAMLDNTDDLTRKIINTRGGFLDRVEEVSFGDPSLSRNKGALSACGEYLAFLDGDDLWGADWLKLAYKSATAPDAPAQAIWHPECLFLFAESDFIYHSTDYVPHPAARSHNFLQHSSDEPGFRRDVLFFENIWSANALAGREIYLMHPYKAVNKQNGFGIEDWSWNIETLWAGIPHRLVPETVHLIRIKETESFGRQNYIEGLLPFLPEEVRPKLGE
jgi:glycosyltransferase involved in cell wall biosynthesis